MTRIRSVDFFRLLAITAVIIIHTEAFMQNYHGYGNFAEYIAIIINQLARFAVPFFFVISGYFWGIKSKDDFTIASNTIKMAKRILFIFLFWTIFYALPYNLIDVARYGLIESVKTSYWNFIKLVKEDTITFLMQGTSGHLYFLISLLWSLFITYIFVKRKSYIALIIVAFSLYVISLLLGSGSYALKPFGVEVNFRMRFGPFVGTIFFVSGYFLSKYTPNPRWFGKGLAIFGIGMLIHFSEIYLLSQWRDGLPFYEYLLGTYFMGVGVAVASLSNNSFISKIPFDNVGSFTLGIYAIHVVFINILQPYMFDMLVSADLVESWFVESGYVLLVLLLSALSAVALSKFKITRRFVV